MKKIYDLRFMIYDSKGFTLIEMLASIAVVMALGGIITSILFSTFRGTGKTNIITTVRQNGSFALGQMEKMLHNAQSIESVGGGVGTPCQNLLLIPTPTPYSSIKFISPDQQPTSFVCDIPNDKISSSSASSPTPYELVDPTAVDVVACHFTCTKKTEFDSPFVEIYFELREPDTGLPVLNENTVGVNPIPFRTSVSIRN